MDHSTPSIEAPESGFGSSRPMGLLTQLIKVAW